MEREEEEEEEEEAEALAGGMVGRGVLLSVVCGYVATVDVKVC
jgi:hypothetical protein